MTALPTNLPAETYHLTDSIADDVLDGAEQISVFTGDTIRRVNYLLSKKMLPAFREGKNWKMRKSTYRAYIERLERAAFERIITTTLKQ